MTRYSESPSMLLLESATRSNRLFERQDAVDTLQTDSYQRPAAAGFRVTPGETHAISLADITTVNVVFVEVTFVLATDVCQIQINTGSGLATIDMRPLQGVTPANTFKARFLMHVADVTALNVIVPGTQTNGVEGQYMLLGDVSS